MIWGINKSVWEPPWWWNLHIPSSVYLWPHLCHLGSSWNDPEVGLPVRCDPQKIPKPRRINTLEDYMFLVHPCESWWPAGPIFVTPMAAAIHRSSWMWTMPGGKLGRESLKLLSCFHGFCFKRNPLKPQNPHHFSICLSARDAQRGIAFGSRENGRAHPFVGIGFARGIWGEKPW